LYRLLAPVYSQYCGLGYVQELRTPGGQVRLSDSQQERLNVAYAQLQQSDQLITVHALGRAAGINTVYASSYLYQQGCMPLSKQQRLDSAYAQLHESGQQIIARLLAKTAHVENTYASLYLQQRGQGVPLYERMHPTEDRALRVAAAYARMQQSGQPITRRTLGAAAHVNWHYAAAYIQQQQGAPARPPRFGGKRDTQEREARLSRAYDQLQHSAHPLSAEALCKAAHVRRETAAAYLQQRRASTPEEALV
jgi:hypothetical protein